MRYTVCPDCGEYIPVLSADKDELGWHTSCPKCKGSFDIDVEDYLIAVGERVRTSDGKVGAIKEFRIPELHIDFDEVVYFVHFGMSGYGTFYPRHELTQPADWRLTRRDQYGVQRECHYPRNREYGNVFCTNCVDRTKCNADIFERLAQYEDTGLLPEEILKMKEKIVQ